MPGAWDSTPKSQPLSRSVPQTPAASNSEEEDDSVPAFPALNSIQRSGFSRDVEPEPPEPSPSIRVLADDDDAKLMPPPTFLPPRAQQTGSGLSARGNQQSSLSSPSSLSSSSLLVPLSTRTVPPNTNTKKSARAKVALAPGHSPLDWAHLKSSGEDLRVRRLPLFVIVRFLIKKCFSVVHVFEFILRCVQLGCFILNSRAG